MVLFMSNNFAIAETSNEAFAKSLGSSFNIENAYSKLLPNAKDREFVQKNKNKLHLTEDDILDASRGRFDREIASGRVEDPNSIHHRDLNMKSTILSQRNDEASKDRSGTTPSQYMDIAINSLNAKQKHVRDLEEKPILDSLKIIENPQEALKTYGIDVDCEEEENSTQAELEPDIEEYTTKKKLKETIEEQKICEESEPVIFQCERVLNLSCVQAETTKGDPNKMDWSGELKIIAGTRMYGGDQYMHGMQEMILFLYSKAVCFANMPKHINPHAKISWTRDRRVPADIVDRNIRYMQKLNKLPLESHPCEVPQEKKCLKWKEEWRNKCEQDLKEF